MRRPWIFAELKGESYELKKSTLYHALLCFGYLMELYREDFAALKKVIVSGLFQESILLDESKWYELSLLLQKELSHDRELMVSKVTLGRMKMMLGYLLQGNYPELEGKKALRAKTLQEFREELAKIFL